MIYFLSSKWLSKLSPAAPIRNAKEPGVTNCRLITAGRRTHKAVHFLLKKVLSYFKTGFEEHSICSRIKGVIINYLNYISIYMFGLCDVTYNMLPVYMLL